jgi:hypothetical protein
MNTPFRRVVLAIAAAFGLFVGIWAQFFPDGFYSSFPGLGFHWVSENGAFDEHLIRDIGGLYLGLSAITLVAMFARTAETGRLAGLGWSVFGLLHLGFHVTHLVGDAGNRVAAVASLSIAALAGLLALFAPARRARPQAADR